MITDLRLGSLMEQDFGCPVVTIEAGGSLDETSEVVAQEGVARFFLQEDLFSLGAVLYFMATGRPCIRRATDGGISTDGGS